MQENNNEIDLTSLFELFTNKILTIFVISTLFGLISFYSSFLLDKKYSADALISISNSNESLQSFSSGSSLGALAAISGFNIGGGGADKGNYVMEVIQSRQFLEHLLNFDGVLENLMAFENYDEKKKAVEYSKFYDPISKEWSRPTRTLLLSLLGKNFKTNKPTILETHSRYKNLLSLNQDRQSRFISISVTHKSPDFAKYLLDLIINELNNLERSKDLYESRQALDFLYSEMKESSQIRDSMSQLIETQLQKQMLTQIGDDYLIEFIDKSYLPEEKSSPQRSIFLIFGLFFGFIFSIFYIYISNKNIKT